jgi:hypothetical protein
MKSEQIIFIAGFFNIFCAVLHIFFPAKYEWNKILSSLREDLRGVILANLHIMNICLLLIFAIAALLSIKHASDIVNTSLGKTIMASFTVFWIIRSLIQIFVIFISLKMGAPSKIIREDFIGLALFIAGVSLYLIPLVQVI